jgi:RHS repeat-associated protein
MQLASSGPIPDGLLATIALRNEKPRLGVPSSEAALHLGHHRSNSEIVLGIEDADSTTRVRSSDTGKERDSESGNDYFGARYYGSSMARFMSPDDGTDQDPSDPQSWNLYAYVRNNPLINTDPDGHDCVNASNAANGTISVQSTQNASDCKAGYTYVDGTVGNSYTYKNGQVGFDISNYADGSGTAGSVTMLVGNQADPDTLKAAVFGSPSAQTWANGAGAVNTMGAIALTGASVVAPELLLEDTELMGGLGLEMEATQNLEIVAADGTKITGFTEHGVDRAIGDAPKGTAGARAGTKPQAILDALKNPKSIRSGVDSQGRPFKVFTGQDARVVVNPSSGKVVSVNPLSGAGAH